MTRLLDQEDFDFLAAQPGFRPEIARKLRSQRRRVMRLYLRALSKDFNQLHARARRLVAAAPEEHHNLVGVLIRQRATFFRVRSMIEMRLALDWLLPGSVDIRPLLGALEKLQAELQMPAPTPAAG
jgi:hypothetical protein